MDEGEDGSTTFTHERLLAEGSLNEEDFAGWSIGYSLLRSVDHNLRLIVGRSTRLPVADHPAAGDVAIKLGLASASQLHVFLADSMKAIRHASHRTTAQVPYSFRTTLQSPHLR